MALLGRRIAQMHRALAVSTGDPHFEPEPVTAQDLAAWKANAARELDATFAKLAPAMASMGETARAAAEALLQHTDALRVRLAGIEVPLQGLVKTRYHGDLHLGQVLVVQDDFTIVDFEGEPGRPVEERRAKSCVLRDVAGMLRSFSYAAHAALLRREAGAPPTEDGAKLLTQWQREASHHFLEGYSRAAEGLASVPRDPAALRALLDLFLVEKALYELRYELANRADWVEIPLRGLLEIANP
jgi:maltose alpha-D-glucosyltransferase/alpha-amylase